ncbi:MAG: hypothetical protein OSB62_06635 [Alphaproteobacteria bacterium]|nr:hypothetical protein [Alphaproteobacteria bacterium]
MSLQLKENEQKIVVHIPMALKTWGGKKVIVGPTGQDLRKLDRETRKDEKLIKALGRAYKWHKWLETGKCSSAEDISQIENINKSYIIKIMRLMKLSPKIIEAVLDGRQPDNFGLSSVEHSFPMLWSEQEQKFQFLQK